jgi:hypothetical protein
MTAHNDESSAQRPLWWSDSLNMLGRDRSPLS